MLAISYVIKHSPLKLAGFDAEDHFSLIAFSPIEGTLFCL